MELQSVRSSLVVSGSGAHGQYKPTSWQLKTTPQKLAVVLLTAPLNVGSWSQIGSLRPGGSTVQADAPLLVLASGPVVMLRWDSGGTCASAC